MASTLLSAVCVIVQLPPASYQPEPFIKGRLSFVATRALFDCTIRGSLFIDGTTGWLHNWLPVHLVTWSATWLLGYLDIWLLWLLGYLATLATWLLWLLGHFGYLATWLLWPLGYLDTWLLGYLATWLLWLRG